MSINSIGRLAAYVALCGLMFACSQDSSSSGGLGDEADGGRVDSGSLIVFQCADGVDNDGDGQIDLDDPGCDDAQDEDESDEPRAPQCDDGLDNDEDGQTDLDDRGCASRADDNEGDEQPLPECSDGLDNDNDGFVDFPADPGCGSEFDGREQDDSGPVLPQCANGVDDDNDGLVDIADPGCSSVADPREQNMPDENPACSNRLDDDSDGIIDFPAEPGCSAAGDDDESDPMNPPACGNGNDDDGDGEIDYPNDPGCAGVGDRDETDPVVPPRCSDGVDNDRDNAIDYPADRGCQSAADGSEGGACGRTYQAVETEAGEIIRGDSRRGAFASEGSCGGRGSPEVVLVHRVEGLIEALVIRTDLPDNELETTIYVRQGCLDPSSEIACNREPADGLPSNRVEIDNPPPGEYYIFIDGVSGGGDFAVQIEEVPRAQCLNGIDDDDDGRVDYPHDPGCFRPSDRDEADPPVPPVCSDDIDNDGDGVIDYPLDFGCQSAADGDEVDVCGQGVRIETYPFGVPSLLNTTENGGNNHSGSCEMSTGPDRIFLYENPNNAALRISVNHPETIARTTLYVRSACNAGELACNRGDDASQNRGTVELERVPPGPLFIFVDHPFGLGGQFRLSIEAERLPPGCSDEIDNDEDGFFDGDDVGCESADDEDERDPPVGEEPPACFDGLDNDGDGLIDYPFDPGCSFKGSLDEADPPVLAECANGIDDDDDGQVDFPIDVGCTAAADESEEAGRRAPKCANRIDDDQDSLTDYPNDPGCAGPGDMSEIDDATDPACADGIDNDRDGIADYPFDIGCVAAGDRDELDPMVAPACFNQIDDDEDGAIDFPFDPGCVASSDDDETDPNFPPACSNGRDDDNDGLIDFPNDRGCQFAGDPREEDPFYIPPRCSDGIDNDGDAIIDLSDPGCANVDDDDETDPAELPECGNGIDDDEDGQLDWPADLGCQAFGDALEEQQCQVAGPALELARNGSVMGTTLENGVDNHRNRCGGRDAPDQVYRYVVEEGVARVTFSTANDTTDFPVILSVLNDCDEPRSELACAGDFRRPSPTISLADPEPGEYYIVVDGGGPERWEGSSNPIQMPADPRNFAARNDINNNCWQDGGNDAFDCYGRVTVSRGAVSQVLNIGLGNRQVNVDGVNFTVFSELSNNVWRLRFVPTIENDDRTVSFTVTGNLGSDGSTQAQQGFVDFEGRQVRYLHTTDGRPSDPPVTHIFVPSDPEQLGAVSYANAGDNVTINVNNITLPATFYVALSYAGVAPVANAIVSDLQVRGQAGGNDASRFGNFELTATEE